MNSSTMSFVDENGNEHTLAEDSFLLFVDETGEESLKDPNYPIFGLGGCGLPAKFYYNNIVRPWTYLKDQEFGGKNNPLHATNLTKNIPSKKQLDILNKFFSTYTFTRIATVLSDKTVFETDVDIYHLIVGSFIKRLLKGLSHTEYNGSVTMVMEESNRTDNLAKDFFERYSLQRTTSEGKTTPIEFNKFRMSKLEMEPGLEVADFIIHTAGTSVRDRLTGKRTKEKERPDFGNIFINTDSRLTDFLEITKVVDTD